MLHPTDRDLVALTWRRRRHLNERSTQKTRQSIVVGLVFWVLSSFGRVTTPWLRGSVLRTAFTDPCGCSSMFPGRSDPVALRRQRTPVHRNAGTQRSIVRPRNDFSTRRVKTNDRRYGLSDSATRTRSWCSWNNPRRI